MEKIYIRQLNATSGKKYPQTIWNFITVFENLFTEILAKLFNKSTFIILNSTLLLSEQLKCLNFLENPGSTEKRHFWNDESDVFYVSKGPESGDTRLTTLPVTLLLCPLILYLTPEQTRKSILLGLESYFARTTFYLAIVYVQILEKLRCFRSLNSNSHLFRWFSSSSVPMS